MRSEWLLSLLLAGAAVMPMDSATQEEPSYDGKPISYWFEHAFDGPNAMTALKAMGSNAVPFLTDILETKPSTLGKAADEAISDLEIKHGQKIPDSVRNAVPSAFRTEWSRQHAAYLIGQLGADAASAVPALLKVLEDPTENWRLETEVRLALLSLGENAAAAVPHYMDYLKGDNDSQAVGANLLASVGPKARIAVPLLIEAADSTNGQVRWAAARALWNIDRQTNVALRIFLKGLESPNETTRQIALAELRQMGPAAKEAGSAIQAALTDQDDQVRLQAEKALREIDPSLLASNLQQMNANTAAAVEKLIGHLKSTDPREQFRALEIIGVFGEDAKPAVPALIQILNGSGLRFPSPFAGIGLANSQCEAARALAKIGPEARAAAPALISQVRRHVQYEAEYLKALGRIGDDAHDAIPLLQDALTNDNRGFQLVAADALTRIAPHDCSNAVTVLRELQHIPKLPRIWLLDSNEIPHSVSGTNFDDPTAPYFYAAASVPLWKLGLEKEPPVKVIIGEMTKYPGPFNEQGYVELLGDIGPEAKPALPLLEKRLRPEWGELMARAAAIAIRKIDPAEAARLGLPGLLAVP